MRICRFIAKAVPVGRENFEIFHDKLDDALSRASSGFGFISWWHHLGICDFTIRRTEQITVNRGRKLGEPRIDCV